MNIFEYILPKYELPSKPKLFEAFAGIGCQRMAFDRLGIEYEMVGISEIDKFAIQSYMAIHGETKNFGSICDIERLPEIDVFTWSFPCTDLSKAGKQKGLTNTRSGLVYEVLRILHNTDLKPKVLIMENVVDLVQAKFIREFNAIQHELELMGYTNYTKTMNAKDFGVAQNRDRVFMVSILGDYYYEFPKTFKLEKRLKDYLEDEVDEKYYLSDRIIGTFLRRNEENEKKGNGFKFEPRNINGVGKSILTMAGSRPDDNFIKEPIICASRGRNPQNPKSRESGLKTAQMIEPKYDGTSNTLTTVQKDNLVIEPTCLNSKVDGKQPSLSDRIYDSESIACAITTSNFFMPNYTIDNAKGLYLHDSERFQKEPLDEISRCLKANKHDSGVIENNLRIRKLTPLECWRLMGIDDDNFRKAEKVCSNSQLYKQAGNGIVVDVFAAIISAMKGD